jgi:menaquinol-cytochrome c reductase iron-sulfur subunit
VSARSSDGGPLRRANILPACFAGGLLVLLAGLIVDLEVIAPLGGAIILVAGFLWARRNLRLPPPEFQSPPGDEGDAERFPRSRLLEAATVGIGSLVGLAAGLPVAAFAVLPSFLGQRQRAADLGPLDAFPEGQFVIATFLSDPQAGEISRRTVFVRNNGPLGNLPSFTIMSSRCTHVGCPTQPNGPIFLGRRKLDRTANGEISLVPRQPSGFGCPCHGSQFDTEGNRIAGPAPRALDRYEFSVRDGRLLLGRLYSVNRVQGAGAEARIQAFAHHFAGEPVSGLEAWLYPVSPSG